MMDGGYLSRYLDVVVGFLSRWNQSADEIRVASTRLFLVVLVVVAVAGLVWMSG
jgi:hypothetical protein